LFQILTNKWFINGTAVHDKSGNFFEVKKKACQDVKDVHQAQTQHQAPSRKRKQG
jgi:hypothetical protein